MTSRTAWVLSALALSAGVGAAWGQTLESLPVAATLNGRAIGEVTAYTVGTNLVSLDWTQLTNQLATVLAPAVMNKLNQQAADNRITPEKLTAAGVPTQWDMGNLAVHLEIPADQRAAQTTDFREFHRPPFTHELQPSEFSGFLNLRGGWDYIERSPSQELGGQTPQFDLENAFNWHGLVLENEASYNLARPEDWQKGNSRLVWDQPDSRLRWQAGDMTYPTVSFQPFIPMAGLGVYRENALQPYRVTEPLGNTTFLLKQDSKVEVLLNGMPVQTLQLPAGPHNLRNFPFNSGGNDVVLRITDPVGHVEYTRLSFFFDTSLLAAGEQDFNYSVGFPSFVDPESAFYHYQTEPLASVYHRWGVTDRLTLGAQAQANENGQLGGVLGTWANPLGIWGAEAAASQHRSLGVGGAYRLQYHYFGRHDAFLSDGVLSLGAQYQDRRFSPGLSGSLNPVAWDFQAQYSQRLSSHWSGGLGLGYRLDHDNNPGHIESLLVSWYGQRATVSFTFEHNGQFDQRDEWRGFVSLTMNFGRGHMGYASYDSSTEAERVQWQYTPPSSVEGISGSLGYQHLPTQDSFDGGARYVGRRAEITLTQNTTSDGTDSRTSLRWGSALVYADGEFGLSRPIRDSFVLLDAAGDLAKSGVGTLPQAGHYTAQTDVLGPAVVPDLTSYYYQRLVVEPLDPEADYNPNDGDFLYRPRYKSGAHIRAGHAVSLTITAQLRWRNGQPAALLSGAVENKEGPPLEFITNREGTLFLEGLQPGTHQAHLTGYEDHPFSLVVPAKDAKDSNPSLNLGTLTLPCTP